MSKRVIIMLLVLITLTISTMAYDTTVMEDYIPSLDKTTLENLMQENLDNMKYAHEMAEAARNLGYEEEHPIIILAKNEYNIAKISYERYKIQYQEIIKAEEQNIWYQRSKEYPVATEIWLFLKDLGYNDYVCAGIIGNMMSETGGQTLNIKVDLYNSTRRYYGICQWGPSYKEIWGADLKNQCEFLANSIKYNFDVFGYAYKKNFDFEDFLNLTNEKDAALAFAKCYERCASSSYNVRQKNATKALEYFTGNIEG
jgi:hypothetical protein